MCFILCIFMRKILRQFKVVNPTIHNASAQQLLAQLWPLPHKMQHLKNFKNLISPPNSTTSTSNNANSSGNNRTSTSHQTSPSPTPSGSLSVSSTSSTASSSYENPITRTNSYSQPNSNSANLSKDHRRIG